MPDSPSAPTEWCYEPMPPVTGWFAVQMCYEVEEGVFPGAAYVVEGKVDWPESRGMAKNGCTGHAGPFETEEEARAWAYAHDPEWPDRPSSTH